MDRAHDGILRVRPSMVVEEGGEVLRRWYGRRGENFAATEEFEHGGAADGADLGDRAVIIAARFQGLAHQRNTLSRLSIFHLPISSLHQILHLIGSQNPDVMPNESARLCSEPSTDRKLPPRRHHFSMEFQ